MVIVSCPAPGCSYSTDDLPVEIVSTLLTIHAQEHTRAPITASKGPKLNRPVIDVGVDEETWNAFIRRWETFRRGSDINEAAAPTQLFQCASEPLGDLLLKSDPALTSRSTQEVLAAMRSIAVIPVARGVTRAELTQMSQSSDEPIRTFAARVRGKAETCGFTTSVRCECGKELSVDYTSETVRDVILAGINDNDIRREALSAQNLQTEPINSVISFIESREMARNATPSTSVSTMSSYRKEKQTPSQANQDSPPVPCPECGKRYQRFRPRPGGGINRQPYKQCIDCWRTNKQKQSESRKDPSKSPNTGSDVKAIESDHVTQVSAVENNSGHPKVTISVGFAEWNNPRCSPVEAIADTGAQSNVWGLEDFKAAGFLVKNLKPSNAKIRAANASQMSIVGQFKGLVKGIKPNGEDIYCESLIYVSDSVKGFYLSYETMIKLQIIDRTFPVVGSCLVKPKKLFEGKAIR